MVNNECFLWDRQGEPIRDQLWGHYKAIEKYFLCSLGHRIETSEVQEGGAWFFDNGVVEIPVSSSNQGVIFHEFTHDLFHCSVFHSKHNSLNKDPNGNKEDAKFNQSWGEGFCEAIRWLMETKYIQKSEWLNSYMTKTGWEVQRAERILNYTGRTLTDFARGWIDLISNYDQTSDYLNRTIK